ncbi:MAG: carboxypeptidase regulatory-like domain-containing protein [Fibrobacterales bacterium]|nr:carboxypeptidase regulatory-like domain-containing protein [Fibrobacterales bacterium]
MRRLLLALSPALLSALMACGETTVAGGGSDQPNEIVATVLSVSGAALPNAKVSVWRRSEISPMDLAEDFEFCDSAATDQNGRFKLRLANGRYAIEVHSDDSSQAAFIGEAQFDAKSALFFDNAAAGDSTEELRSIKLSKAASVSGTILAEDEGRELIEMQLSGLPHAAPIDEEGNFRFVGLPPRTVTLLTKHRKGNDTAITANKAIELKEGGRVKLGTLALRPGEVVLDDFEDGNGQISLAGVFGNGWWYSAQQPWGSILKHPKGLVDIADAIEDEEGVKTLHVGIQFPGIDLFPEQQYLALVGFNLGAGYTTSVLGPKAFFDFTKAKSLSIRVKGTGSFRIQVATKATKEADGWGHFISQEIALPQSGYERISVPFSQLAPQEFSMAAEMGMTWEDVRNEVYAIDFLFSRNANIWIDEIRLIGAEVTDF